jgi:ABC-type maltose transport system permease subunit
MAYAVVSSLPIVAIFVLAQRWFISGLTAGAVKG